MPRSLNTHARSTVLWGLAAFLCAQFGLNVAMDRWRAEVRDPEFAFRLQRLQKRMAAERQRPLIVMLGSSRTAMGVRPEALPAEFAESPTAPLVFNFGVTGAGPVQQLLYLHRLLAAGVRPRFLFVEVMPILMFREHEEEVAAVQRGGLRDLAVLHRYCDDPAWPYFQWCHLRAAPWYSFRFFFLERFAPSWVPWESRQSLWWDGLDAFGWVRYPRDTVTADELERAKVYGRLHYLATMRNGHIQATPDRALREILDLCRRHGIATALYVMPEGTEFASWYSTASRDEFDGYLAGLRRGYAVPVIDARDWIADAGFVEYQHLLATGAAEFTERFGREVLTPLLHDKLAASGKIDRRANPD